MKKINIFIVVVVLIWSLTGCHTAGNAKVVVNQEKKEFVSHTDSDQENPSTDEAGMAKPAGDVPRTLIYQDKNISVVVDQLIYIRHGTDVIRKTEEGHKTSIVMKYTYNGEVHHMDLSELATAYGVKRITASPNAKYVALEFGAGDCNETILVDTINKTAIKLEEYYKDADARMPMVSVSWKPDDDNVFAYFPAFFTNDEYIELKVYDITNKSGKMIYKLNSNECDTLVGSIITWKKGYIEVFEGTYEKVIKIENP